jgi:hypothetical protein
MLRYDGETGEQVKLQMFGDKKASFNPTHEESCDIENKMSNAAQPPSETMRGF